MAPVLLGMMLGPGACAQRNPGITPADCRPAEGVLAAGTDPSALVGSYQLLLIVGRGATSGESVSGALGLTIVEGGIQGTAVIALERVGAHRHGDLGSTDPRAPGVLALPQGDRILLRFGSEANRKDIQAFEAPYMVLHVRRLTETGFAGTWASGAERTDAEGHFCAVRTE
jgi:hypothetical protein